MTCSKANTIHLKASTLYLLLAFSNVLLWVTAILNIKLTMTHHRDSLEMLRKLNGHVHERIELRIIYEDTHERECLFEDLKIKSARLTELVQKDANQIMNHPEARSN